jgi:hypothetical protein
VFILFQATTPEAWKNASSIYEFTVKDINGQDVSLEKYRYVIIYCSHVCMYGLGSSVSIATGYGLDGPGIESWWGRDFSHTSRPALGHTQPPVQWVLGLSRG